MPQLSRAADEVVNIYSARKEALILPLLERFKQETGIDFKLVTGKADALLKRLELEGKLSPADVFITTDAGRLHRAKQAGVLQAINSDVLNQRIPANLRDQENQWFGMSERARPIIYAPDRVNPSELSTYEALTDSKWQGRICIRSSGNIYNQSMIVSMMEANGADKTEAWARGLVANFARPPAGGDTDQLKAAAAGLCDIAIANTYYLGRLLNSAKKRDRAIGEQLAVFWPNQGEADRGAHVNVSGAAVTRHSKNVKAAQRLLEFMVTDQSQQWYAEVNNEYPVVAGVDISTTLQGFGQFKADTINLTVLGEKNADAVKLMDRAGWR
ncbi:MAG: Fe(3+) ABC transporter substrate-binding protein [Gammaproteobacteria bacterium]|nr:Fe(3+) ABC transporter substrate-binding protein [Gammaproteobacteria bacterium]